MCGLLKQSWAKTLCFQSYAAHLDEVIRQGCSDMATTAGTPSAGLQKASGKQRRTHPDKFFSVGSGYAAGNHYSKCIALKSSRYD